MKVVCDSFHAVIFLLQYIQTTLPLSDTIDGVISQRKKRFVYLTATELLADILLLVAGWSLEQDDTRDWPDHYHCIHYTLRRTTQ